jgi:hypothetical protein
MMSILIVTYPISISYCCYCIYIGFYEIVTRKEAERRLERTRPLPDREQLLRKLKELNVEVVSLSLKDEDDGDDHGGDKQ